MAKDTRENWLYNWHDKWEKNYKNKKYEEIIIDKKIENALLKLTKQQVIKIHKESGLEYTFGKIDYDNWTKDEIIGEMTDISEFPEITVEKLYKLLNIKD